MRIPIDAIQKLPDPPTVQNVAELLLSIARTTWTEPFVFRSDAQYVGFFDLDPANALIVEVRQSASARGTAIYVDLSCSHALMELGVAQMPEEGFGSYPVTYALTGVPEMTKEKRTAILASIAKFVVIRAHPFCNLCGGGGE